MSAGIFAAPAVAAPGYHGLRAPPAKQPFATKNSVARSSRTVSNGSKTFCMKTWNPINNKKFEALSYLPPLSEDSIAKEIDYMMKNGWIPCLEFDEVSQRLSFSPQLVSDLCISCIWSTAGCRDTTMEGTGHCGSSPCLDAPTPPKSSKKSRSAKKHIQMLTSVAWLSTTSNRLSAWLLSFKNLVTEVFALLSVSRNLVFALLSPLLIPLFSANKDGGK
ncbi:hypothetical protein POTOM_057338 [Populus tomentosa]|uniref:Ribulose bisphosphate carboxylase small subunit domain-containing protein n=1 Tax=Populus tomentosa TaxID=118781 RepID=A0A8X7XT25_POPTO|nr:hypothetical protein POTOM_057338 [Populus tomentosa]